jgi:hypothetical protein
VVVPRLGGELGARVAVQAGRLSTRHAVVTVPVDGLEAALRACPARLSTMGRGLDEDMAYFLAAAAAGRHAARLLRAALSQLVAPGVIASMMSTTNTSVSVPLMPAWEAPEAP